MRDIPTETDIQKKKIYNIWRNTLVMTHIRIEKCNGQKVVFVAILLKKQNLKHSPNVRNKNNLDEIHNRNDKHHIIYTDFYRLCNLSNFTEKKMTRTKNV